MSERSEARMPRGWQGVCQAADEWVRFALLDATGQSRAISCAGPLLRLAEQYGIPVEELVEWIYTARDPRDGEAWLEYCEWRRERLVLARQQTEAAL